MVIYFVIPLYGILEILIEQKVCSGGQVWAKEENLNTRVQNKEMHWNIDIELYP